MMAMEFSFPFEATYDPETGMPELNGQGEPDRLYGATEDAMRWEVFFGDGVFPNPANNLKVDAYGGMSVVVRMGTATIRGYAYRLYDEDMIIAVPAAHTSLGRKDIVVVALDMLDRSVKVEYKAGTPASNPQEPPLVRTQDRTELKLAIIVIDANTTTVSQSAIADTRYNAGVCGISSFNGAPIDVTGIYNQFQTYLTEQIALWNSIRNTQESQWQNQTDQIQTAWNTWFATIHVDLQTYAIFNFDNLAALPGVERSTVFGSTTMTETIKISGTSITVATRATDFNTMISKETVYGSDSVTVIRMTQTTTTFPGGEISEVVTL